MGLTINWGILAGLIGVILVVAGLVLAVFAAQAFHVFLTFFRTDQSVANEAMRRGASFKAWWNPSLADRPLGAQDKYRKGRRGRRVADIGMVAQDQYVSNHKLPR